MHLAKISYAEHKKHKLKRKKWINWTWTKLRTSYTLQKTPLKWKGEIICKTCDKEHVLRIYKELLQLTKTNISKKMANKYLIDLASMIHAQYQ